MKILKFIGQGILYFIALIIFAVVLVLGILFIYFPLQTFLFGRGDYLLFISGDANMIPVYMIMALIVYFASMIKEKFFKRKDEQIDILEEDEEPLDIEQLSKKEQTILTILNKFIAFDDITTKIFKVIKLLYIPTLIIAIYCGVTSYAILYKDSIKLSSPIKPIGTIYMYSDISTIDVRINKYKRNSYEPNYIITLKDGKSINLFGGSMHTNDDRGFEFIILDLDEKLKVQGVPKTVDKTNFENHAKDLDKDFISRVEKLFDNK
jgi:hypothetical protein